MILLFLVLFVFWLVLSGRFQAKYIILGVVSAALITWFTSDHFYAVLQDGEFRKINTKFIIIQLWRFIIYIPWLIWQIAIANIQVAYYVLHPKMPIDPGFLMFKTTMKKGMSQVTLANSITLTPGTITARMENGKYTVHTLKRPLASLIETGAMQKKVSKIFSEEEEPAPSTRWVRTIKETNE